MLRHLVLAVLMLLVAVPATAASELHAQPAPHAHAAASACHESATNRSHRPQPGTPMAPHDVICCAAFYGAPSAPLASAQPTGPLPLDMVEDGLALARSGPEAPPPKA